MATPQAFKASCDEIFGASKSIHVSGATPSSQTNSISSGIYNQVKFNYFIINYYYMAYFVQKIKINIQVLLEGLILQMAAS